MCTVELKDVIYSSNQIPGDERMGRGSIQGSNSWEFSRIYDKKDVIQRLRKSNTSWAGWIKRN